MCLCVVSVSLCVCVGVYVSVHVSMCLCVCELHVSVCVRGQFWELSLRSHLRCFLRHGILSDSPEVHYSLDWRASEPQGLACLWW